MKTTVEFLVDLMGYRKGERAAMAEHVADSLVRKGLAVVVDPIDEFLTPKNKAMRSVECKK